MDFNQLMTRSLSQSSRPSKGFDVDLSLSIEGETWRAYEASVSYRDILFFTDKGTVTYLVDSINSKHFAVLHDWERN